MDIKRKILKKDVCPECAKKIARLLNVNIEYVDNATMSITFGE